MDVDGLNDGVDEGGCDESFPVVVEEGEAGGTFEDDDTGGDGQGGDHGCKGWAQRRREGGNAVSDRCFVVPRSSSSNSPLTL